MLILFIDLAQACNMLELGRGSFSADTSASFSSNFNKADSVEFGLVRFKKHEKGLFVTFFMQNFIEYVAVSTYKKNTLLLIVSSLKKKTY